MSGIQTSNFGVTAGNEAINLYTITNSRGAQLELIDIGASIRSLRVPAKDGRLVDVVLGFQKLDGYEKNVAHVGCVVGRVCNRIKAGKFTLDGQTYQLAINNGPNHLHGGPRNYGHLVWKVKETGQDFITFEHLSEDGDEGYPSTVRASATYRFPFNANQLIIELDGVNEGDKTTPINLTNHAYFNLGGVDQSEVNIKDHHLTVFSDSYLPVDDDHLVTGEIVPVDGTLFDFRGGAILGDRLHQLPDDGYDCHFCNTITPTPKPLAKLSSPKTGITMTMSSTEPGFQIYTAQYMDSSKITGAKYGRTYGKHSGIAMETQHYPDAVNKPHFPPIWLRPGDKYHHKTVYEFSL